MSEEEQGWWTRYDERSRQRARDASSGRYRWVQAALLCICSPICGRAVSMEKDGSVYSCDHSVYPEYRLGSIARARDESRVESGDKSPHSRLSDLVRSQRQKLFGEAKTKSLPGYCKRCPFLQVCFGECSKRRFLLTPEGEPGLNYLCPGLRLFYDHAGGRLAQYGHQLMAH